MLLLAVVRPTVAQLDPGPTLAIPSGVSPTVLFSAVGTNAARQRYVVVLHRAAPQDALAGEYKVARSRIFRHALNGFVADLDSATVARLNADPRVKDVIEDSIVASNVEQVIPHGVRRMSAHTFPPVKVDGTDKRVDVDVAVIDSGIQADHPDLNVVQSVAFGAPEPVDSNNSHGTACAGIIGALDNDVGVVGVAPGVRLWSVRASTGGRLRTVDIFAAFDYVGAHVDQIAVVSCSFGTFWGDYKSRPSWQEPVRYLVDHGVVVVAGAGNDAGDIAGPVGGLPDDFFDYNDNTYPAALPEVMAVSGVSALSDQFAPYSNFSETRHVENYVNSPGAAIDVAGPTDFIATTALRSGYTGAFAGTSAACPHVAGLVALYIATHGRATNAAGVFAIRQAIVDAALPQSQWRTANTLDRDTNHEGLAMAPLSWATNAPHLLNIIKAASGATVRYSTITGYTHTVQFTETLSASDEWSDFATINGNDAVAETFDPVEASSRFYRLVSQPVPWPLYHDPLLTTNLGSLGESANGAHTLTVHGVAGALASEPNDGAVRCPPLVGGSRVRVPYQCALSPSNGFSIEIWVKPGQTNQPGARLASSLKVDYYEPEKVRYSGWLLHQTNPNLNGGDGFTFVCYGPEGDNVPYRAYAYVTLDTNSWYHVVGVYNPSGVIVLYVNGVSVGVSSMLNPRLNPDQPMIFGGAVGDLDEAAFYTNVLSPAQIQAHYEAGTNAAPAIPYSRVILNDQPVGYWRFDER